MFAALPPSSKPVRFSVAAAARATAIPVGVEPVTSMRSTPGWELSAAPAAGPPVTMLSTPSGSPAACAIRPSSRTESGASSEGLSTTVLPNASAGASFFVAISIGWFQGVIAPQTPTGTRRV